MPSSKKKSPQGGLRFTGPGRYAGVPARDLTDHDIARIAYRRALTVSAADGQRPDPAKPDPALVKDITAELIGSGLYKPED